MAGVVSGRHYGVLHLIGPDRIGILQDAASFVAERGGTTEQGISHTLGTEAVVLLYVSGLPNQIEAIEKDAHRLGESLRMLALFTRIADRSRATHDEAVPLTLRMSSPDFAGLLKTVTAFFTKHQLVIIAHHTIKAMLPYSDNAPTHRHKFTVLIPAEFNRKSFLAELDEICTTCGFLRDDISHTDYY